jgi:tetratricopeptide (TPR) repeat protein
MSRVVLISVMAGLVVTAQPVAQSADVLIVSALDRYSAGRHGEAIAALPRSTDVEALLAAADRWLGPPGAVAPASRQRLAAAFLLDAVFSRTRESTRLFPVSATHADVAGHPPYRRPWPPRLADLGSALPAVAWGCSRIGAAGVVDDLERAWWHLSIALLEEAGEWRALLGVAGYRAGSRLPGGGTTAREIVEGHLPHARARVPDDPRVRLAGVVARTAIVAHPPTLTGVGPAALGLRIDGRQDVLRNVEAAVRAVNGGRLGDLERDFLRFEHEPEVAADALLRAAYLRTVRRQWREALALLDRLSTQTTDPLLLAMADYFRGWIHERESRPVEAIAAYRRAHAFAPRSPSLATLFAAQLFVVDARVEAYSVLDGAAMAPPAYDLVHRFFEGDARLGDRDRARLRRALQ